MEMKKRTFEVRVQKSIVVSKGDALSSSREIPLTIFDRAAIDVHTGSFTAFRRLPTTNSSIIEALSRTLSYFPILAGRLGRNSVGRQCFLVGGGDSGVLVVEAAVDSKLEEHLPLEPSTEMEKLHPSREGTEFLLQIQLNRFECGGLVLGLTVHHRAIDAQSMSFFLNSWGKILNGIPLERFPVLYGACSSLKPRNPPRIEYPHLGREFLSISQIESHKTLFPDPVTVDRIRIDNVLLHFSLEFIEKKLKSGMAGEKYCSTFKAVAGHLWRKITIARGLNGEEKTTMSVAVNGRRRLLPPLPEEFFGNLVLLAHPMTTVKDLLKGSVADAAKLIHEAVDMVGDEYFRSFIDFGSLHEKGDEEEEGSEKLVAVHELFGNVMSPHVEASSSLGFGFEGVEFAAAAPPCGVLPLWIPVEGVLFFVPSMSGGGGGVDVVVTALHEHAAVLRKISHSLD